MKTVFATVLALAAATLIAAAAVITSGVYDVGAATPHWPITYRILDFARRRAVQAHAAGIAPPANLDDPARLVGGAAHFVDHCAPCHGAPGVETEDMAEGMYPKPPSLTEVAHRFAPGELFWILKNGIKMSGMPNWGDHPDGDLWNIVALMEHFPTMSAPDYAKLSTAAAAAGGHHMTGGKMDMPGMNMGSTGSTPDRAAPPK